jgi:hypothetical protein
MLIVEIVHVTINHLQLSLNIFATTSYIGHICNYFGFHPRRTIYVPLVANVTNLKYKGVFCVFSKI